LQRSHFLADHREGTGLHGPSAYLCDGPNNANPSGTCDAPLCDIHARQIGPNRHLCPTCLLVHRDADPQRGLFTSLV
jgi:hypothetical protein